MTRLRAIVELLSPLTLSRTRATGNDLETQSHLPGTLWRGALAAYLLAENDHQLTPAFHQLFLENQVRFGDLRITGATPWPLTAQLCAQHPNTHRPTDILLRLAANLPFADECGDQGCRAKRQPARGFQLLRNNSEHPGLDPEFRTEPVLTRRIAHTAIDPERLTVVSGQFHSLQVLEESQTFQGYVHASDEAAATLLLTTGRGLKLRAGKGRTRGHGHIRLRLTPDPAPEVDATNGIRERLAGLNAQAQTHAALQNQLLFSCTLDSPAVVPDRWLMANPKLNAAQIDPRLHAFELLGWAARLVHIAGWHPVSELPKSEISAIAPGSAFLYGRTATNDPSELANLAQILQEVTQSAIGEMTEQGFGEVTFCAPLHWQRADLP
jgi:CRISPR-associated protein Csx10